MADSSRLGPDTRARWLSQLDRTAWDVVVIGGGVTGAGIALDAASRGLRVVLFEKRDLASGTSSKSSKLLHGGLRYLEQFRIRLVFEALRERKRLLTVIAPHLARVTAFYFPLVRPLWDRIYIGAGIALYDTMSGPKPGVPRHRHYSRAGIAAVAPDLAPEGLRGAIRYSDVQIDDARLVVELARTAAAQGAAILTRCEVVEIVSDDGRVSGVRVRDGEGGDVHEVSARVIINATGVDTTSIDRAAGVRHPVRVEASKGIHILVSRSCITSAGAWITRTARSVLFVLPWGDRWLIGTTDTPYAGSRDSPVADSRDIDYLLAEVNKVARRPISRSDVLGVFAGLRPLVAPSGASADTAAISREHVVHSELPGLYTVVGGKLTTYRVMAVDAVDQAARYLDRRVPPSRTESLPLVNASSGAALDERILRAAISEAVQHRWQTLRRPNAGELLDILASDSTLAQEVPGVPGITRAEVVHAVEWEGALRLEDFLDRRVRLSIESTSIASAAAAEVAAEMGRLLNWTDDFRESHLAEYRATLAGAVGGLAGVNAGLTERSSLEFAIDPESDGRYFEHKSYDV